MDAEQLARWRLILGASSQESLCNMGSGFQLSSQQMEMDAALAEIYGGDDSELSQEEWSEKRVGHGPAKGRVAPKVAKWLDQIRNFFPTDVVTLIQHDAIERRGMKELLFEPEILSKVEPSLDLASTVLQLKNLVPDKAKAAARELVSKVVDDIRKRLEQRFVQAVRGALNRNRHSPFRSLPNLDWTRTISQNIKNYNPTIKTIIPEQMSFFSRQQRQNDWNIIIAMDQSGSMHSSLIFGGIMGAILASMPAVETHVVAFNHHEVVDLTEHCHDPVDLLFGVQLSGAEDYWMATSYCERFMHTPDKTLYIVLGDLYDTSPNENRFVRKMEALLEGGLKAVGLLAISDQGRPSFNENLANKLAKLGMPCFACTPNHLPDMLEAVLRGQDLKKFAEIASQKE
ncbi:VWA domain-containing protein [Blastopirellula sp. JC732]|uniref:VWA domain-containing protein n=1 Tax=Blastopirellula sediminis TaxID=2894196 RepID=A0A9X1SEJ0_9BACT|nr:VWA domain-containing protein [Blastopirellula sediminis]MCC9607954.1 VWA domain-containing protein [Blastopirellula sediminis]MCC9627253.1 VWA domain-containing protein [Blastopirellula sediminis]